MSQTETTRQSDEILPPILTASGGSVLALPCTTSVLIVDLTSMPQTPALPSTTNKGGEHQNPLGQYWTFLSTGTVYLAFGPTAASLTSLSTSATTTVPQGAGATQYQIPSGGTANVGVPIPSNTPFHFRMPPGPTGGGLSGSDPPNPSGGKWGNNSPARYLGALMASGTATLYAWPSSR